MKPCYRRGEDLYLLAHVIREGSQFQQPCKALISPGDCPIITRATGEFLRRCGWLTYEAAPSEEGSETAIVQRAASSKGTAQLIHCKLVVGKCQLSTVLQVVENVHFSDHCVLSKWHIHIGGKDFEALQYNSWDSDICYLSANRELGRLGSPPGCLLSCDSFTTALKNGHRDCLSYWRMVRVTHHQKKDIRHSDPYNSIYAAEMLSDEALMYVHDVLGLPWSTDTFDAAAAFGSIDCLSYAYASGCPCNSKACASAAETGSLHCLAYAHDHACERSSKLILTNAAWHGHLECLKYAHTHGCPNIASRPFHWSTPNPHLPNLAVVASSIPCLAYMREAMGCAWDTEGKEFKLAFERGRLELLQYIHSHGGVLCSRFELLCPNSDNWLNAVGIDAERKAMCLLYMRSYGGCQVKNIWHTKVRKLAADTIKARRVAVLLSFRAAGKVRVGDPLIAAAHAAMHRMPSHMVWEVIRAAGLQTLE